MKSSFGFTDYINDSVRLLIIFEVANHIKPNHRITENRIKLYDYYLKFPHTMINKASTTQDVRINFDEYYAFFHWKPDIVRYRSNLNYLIAKGLIEKHCGDSDSFFTICPQGIEALEKMKSGYKQHLATLAKEAYPTILKLTDKKIEEDIATRTNILLRTTGDKIDED